MSNENAQPEIWQVDVNGQIYEADFKELTDWIAEGALLKQDKVRRGNLRWLEAGKIPLFQGFFNAKGLGTAPPVLIETVVEESEIKDTKTDIKTASTQNQTFQNLSQLDSKPFNPQTQNKIQNSQKQQNFQPHFSEMKKCYLHPYEEVKFVCESCRENFCKACPKSYGGSVKICPLCEGMCNPVAEFHNNQRVNTQYQYDLQQSFGFADFGRALAYPFKFKFSLISGAVLFMFFSLGQSSAGMGGIVMIFAAISSSMMANALIFGCLANTVDNFAQGNLNQNFMPQFDDFNLWDDVIHPFFLSIGAYLVSFGFLIALVIGMAWFTVNTIKTQQTQNLSQLPQQVKEVTRNNRINEKGEMILDESEISNKNILSSEDEKFENLQKTIQEQKQSEFESIVGKDSEAVQKQNLETFQNLIKVGGIFILLAFGALLWGLFYFPAACAVAGYTRSFASTINPLVGLDTIRRMGFDYFKILVMCLILTVIGGFFAGILGAVLSPFDLPGVGNLPAKAVESLFTFYISIVFAVILGLALYKNSAKLNLYR